MSRFGPVPALGLSACVWAVAVAAQAPPAGGRQDPLVPLYNEARKAQAAGDYKTAAERYERIVKLRPDMAEAHSNLGMLYYFEQRTAPAKAAFEKAIALKPDLAGPYFFLGVMAFRDRDYPNALKHLKHAERLDPRNTEIHSYLGYVCYATADYAEATGHLEQAALASEFDQDIHYHLSKSYAQMANRAFQQLQKEHSGTFYSDLARGHFYEAQRNWETAKIEYTRAAEKQPSNDRLQERVRWVSEQSQGKSLPPPPVDGYEPVSGSLSLLYSPPSGERVKRELDRYRNLVHALQPAPDSAEKVYTLGEYYQILSYLASLWITDTAPDSYRAHQVQGQYFDAIDKDEDALREYRRALEINPRLPNVHFLMGNLLWRRERHEEALPELQAELKLTPNYPPALYEIADIHYTLGNNEEAEKYYLEAVKFDPTMAEAHLGLERIYSAQGEYEKALTHLQKVVEIAPDDPTPHYRLGLTYRKAGKEQEAARAMDMFQQLKAKEKAGRTVVGGDAQKPRGKPQAAEEVNP